MGLRVSNEILYSTAVDRIVSGQSDLFKAQQGLVTGKKLNSAADNPAVFTRVANYKNVKGSLEQYKRNINGARGYLAQAESSLDLVLGNLSRAKELAMQGASSGTDSTGFAAIGEEINQIRDQILSLSNSVSSGGGGSGARYIFSGYLTDTAAFDSAGTYGGDTGTYQVEINTGDKVTVGLRGDEIFSDTIAGNVNIFDTLTDIYNYLNAGDVDGVASMIDDLDQARSQVTKAITQVGARQNRLDQTEERLDTNLLSLESFISQDEDLDMAIGATEFARTQTALEASIRSTQAIFDVLRSFSL